MLTRPTILLHLEEALLLALTLFAWQHLHYSWLIFALLFLVPDLSMLGYLLNPSLGAALYNLVHTFTLPFALLLTAYLLHRQLTIPLVWIAHIALDRLLGFGLKYPTTFKDTHLQHIP